MVVVRAALLWMLGLGFFASAWSDSMPRGAIVDLVAGHLSTQVGRQLDVQARLALFHTHRIGQSFGGEVQSAMEAFILRLEVIVSPGSQDLDETARAEMITTIGRPVNLELAGRGLSGQNYLAAQTKAECEQHSTAMLAAERPCQVIRALSGLESSPHSRVRVDEVLRGWLILVASVAGVILLALIVVINDSRITAWIARQEDLTKSSADVERLATHPSGTGQP